MIGTERWEFLPACLRAGGGVLVLAAVMGGWAALIGGCVREYPDDHWLSGVQCKDGICLAERPDRRASTFTLEAPEEAGIVAQRMTLIGDGKDIVFAGIRPADKEPMKSATRLAIARFDGDGDYPAIEWRHESGVGWGGNGAQVVGPDGRFWSFVGDVGGTWGLLAYDRQLSWVKYEVTSPSVALADDVNWSMPNAVGIALPGGVATVRSVARNDGDKTMNDLPTLVEWWTFSPNLIPSRAAQAEITSDPEYGGVKSIRGQVRLLSLGEQLGVLGDQGKAMALSAGASIADRLAVRPADPTNLVPSRGSSSVLLPFRPGSSYAPGSLLYIGGGSDGEVNPNSWRRLDLFDPASATWTSAPHALPRGRDSATPVLLPDGRILLAGDSTGARDIFYIDPLRGFTVTVSHDILSRTRGLGLGGLVVADGRVVLAGGSQPDGEAPRALPDVDVWEPPYLDAGARAARPTIANVSGSILIEGRFSIDLAADSPPVTEVVLLAHSSSFMGNNNNQRLVQLEMEHDGNAPGSTTIKLHGPPAGWAPAGRYLLFALGGDRIPSEGKPVDVVEAAASP